ncbi:MAG TPA: tetratricopeptide repeat protein [Ktedonobacteraceae bacterium]|nr:tetratricopeptide repeat protein [Ktedonobacteraceae bacterium]
MGAWQQMSYASACTSAQQVLTALPHDGQVGHFQVWRGVCLFIVGTGYMYENRLNDARSAFLGAYKYSLVAEDRHFTCGLLLLLGVCCSMLGELYQAREHYRQALADARKQEDHEVIARSLLELARIAFAWRHLSLAEQQINEALMFVPEENVHLRNEATLHLAELAYACRRISESRQQAEELLARLRLAPSHEASQLLPQVVLFMARRSLDAGAIQDAAQLLAMLDLESMAVKIFQARLLLAQSKPREAVLFLEGLLPDVQCARIGHQYQRGHRPFLLWEWRMLSALPRDRKGKGEHSTASKGETKVPSNQRASQSNLDKAKATLPEVQDQAG